MTPFWMAVISLLSSVLLLLTACGSASTRGTDPPADVYLARPPRQVALGKMIVQHIINQLGGDIVVITGPGGRILTDVIATGGGSSMEAARVEVGRHITVTNDGTDIEVRLVPDEIGKGPDMPVHVLFHVVVPLEADLPDLRTHAGNIEVNGNVGKVTAVIADKGNIEVRGANGAVDLSTKQGSIIVDIMEGQSITASAANGDLDIHAVDAIVSAATTNKNIRFYGTLRASKNHSFTTTGAGSIQIALPPYPNNHPDPQVYRFNVSTSASPVNVEYPARGTGAQALAICGFIHGNGPYDYHVENTPANSGRIEISPVLTGTYFFSGTLATGYFRFDTNQTKVSFYTPIAQSIHIYTTAQLNEINAGKEPIAPDCRDALAAPSDKAIAVTLKTDRGSVYIHHMTMGNN